MRRLGESNPENGEFAGLIEEKTQVGKADIPMLWTSEALEHLLFNLSFMQIFPKSMHNALFQDV